MRIATWNCARGPWPTKRAAIDELGADITVVTEAPRAASSHGLHWAGGPLAQNGTTVIAGEGFEVRPLPIVDDVPCVTPFYVTGQAEFTLLAVWTWPAPPFKNYKEPLLAGLRAYGGVRSPIVVAGDFNGNVRFDRPRTHLKWRTCFAALEDLGLVSAYHAHFNELYGEETRYTQYQNRKESMRFHLDYVFIPREWQPAIRTVRVPPYSDFTSSDHRPVIVDLNLPVCD